VEHQRHLGRRELPGVGEEAAGEHLERQVPDAFREADGVQEVVRAGAVEPGVHIRDAHVQQGQGRHGVHRHQIAQP
jgi:hypothetical protein